MISDALAKGARGFLCLTMDEDTLAPLMSSATSFSSALGPAVGILADHLVNLPGGPTPQLVLEPPRAFGRLVTS